MNSKLLTINQAAILLGVSIQTLRRWEDSGKLSPVKRKASEHRRYFKTDLESFIKNSREELGQFKMARRWVESNAGTEPFSDFYCQNIFIFQARLTRLESELSKIKRLGKKYPLVSAITGEIGNNSFDHNLGNWPDVPGIFFAWDLNKGKIILADRGQGVLATLKKVKPDLTNHRDALKTAFTEVISGRAPEHRGNGLKFVKNVIITNRMSLFFQTGNACLEIKKKDSDIKMRESAIDFRGCLAIINF